MTGPRIRGSGRREELFDALLEIFLVDGFVGFTVEDLALRLRCSKSTLYAVAPSKEQLISAVVRAFFRRATERVETRLAAEPEAVRRVETYLEAIAEELAVGAAAFYADLDTFAPAGEIYARNTAAAARRVQELVAAARPQTAAVDAAFLGAVAAQTMQSIQRGQIATLTSLDDAQAYRALADMVVAGVRRRTD